MPIYLNKNTFGLFNYTALLNPNGWQLSVKVNKMYNTVLKKPLRVDADFENSV